METRIDLESVPPFYQTYVRHVLDYSIDEALEISMEKYSEIVRSIPEQKGHYQYAPGKWTIKELLVHIVDAERIFAYRALRFSRNDKTMLQGFDENAYVPQSAAAARSLSEIARSMELVRASTKDLYRSFTSEMLSRTGSANNTEISVEALGYVTAGHQLHHCQVLTQRYL